MAVALPEIGPSLGALAAPPATGPDLWIPVDDLRLALAGRLFKLAGSARIGGAAAPEILTSAAWGSAWHETVAAVAGRVAATVDRRLGQAAEASRYPARRLQQALVTPADLRAITARLGEGAVGLQGGLEELERARRALSVPGAPGHDPVEEWIDRVTAAARRQESAWRELELALRREEPLWSREFEAVRRWRRPRWPLWTAAVCIYAIAIWAGLVLGGYVPAPTPLTGAVSWFWERF
jgi:hypothetical protein